MVQVEITRHKSNLNWNDRPIKFILFRNIFENVCSLKVNQERTTAYTIT